MNDENSRQSGKLDDNQTAAMVSIATIFVFFAIYWFLQIQSVRELLELAYG